MLRTVAPTTDSALAPISHAARLDSLQCPCKQACTIMANLVSLRVCCNYAASKQQREP